MTSLRSLVITALLPDPPLSGRDLRNWQNICALSSCSRVGVFGLRASQQPCGVTTPRNVEFWCDSTNAAPIDTGSKTVVAARAWPFDPMGHPADGFYAESVARELQDILISFKPHVIVIEGLSLYRYIDTVKQFDSSVVFDCHNVEAMLYQEFADNAHGDSLPARWVRELLPART